MILHILNDEKFIDSTHRYSEGIENIDNEYLVISDSTNLKYIKKTPVKIISNKKIFRVSFFNQMKSYDAVILHNLDFIKIWILILASRKINFIWIGLGTDYNNYIFGSREELFEPITKMLYKTNMKNKSQIKQYLKELFYSSFLIKYAINKVAYFAPVLNIEYDLVLAKNKWFKPKFVDFNYGSGGSNFEVIAKKFNTLGKNILIGNSATYENNHIDMFDQLKDFELIGRKVLCPLSYGKNDYRAEVIKEGEEIFKNSFKPITDFVAYDEYFEMLSTCSIVVMNHIRQQALGNIMIMIGIGAKVYIRTSNPVYAFLQELGLTIFDIEQIDNENDFLTPLNEAQAINNKKIIEERYKGDVFLNKVRAFYNTITSSKRGM